MSEDFCLTHGYDHMSRDPFERVKRCLKCEEDDKADKVEAVRAGLFAEAIKSMTPVQRRELAGKVYRFISDHDPFGDEFSEREADIVRELIQFP